MIISADIFAIFLEFYWKLFHHPLIDESSQVIGNLIITTVAVQVSVLKKKTSGQKGVVAFQKPVVLLVCFLIKKNRLSKSGTTKTNLSS